MKNRPETAAQPHLEFNVEFDETVRLAAEEQTYAATPMVGVERIMFERLGEKWFAERPLLFGISQKVILNHTSMQVARNLLL